MTKDIVAGLGEIGGPISQLISKGTKVSGFDINPKLVNQTKNKKYESLQTRFLHVCIPFNKKFEKNVLSLYKKCKPQGIVIHSTISPGTTKKLQSKLSIPVIYSATRGIHKRMLYDLRRYTKFFAIESKAPKANWAVSEYKKLLKKCKVKSKRMSNPQSLELAKIVVDTSYYGWLINYAQISKMIADKYKVNYDEMWTFSDEIQKFVGNRPKLFPGFIGGHCLDGKEVIYIKTQNGMRPITIQQYVDEDHSNDILSYDITRKKPVFTKVIHKWKRHFEGRMVTLVSRTNRSITTTDEHIMMTSDNLSQKYAKDVSVNEMIPFLAELPNQHFKKEYSFDSKNWRFKYNMPKKIKIDADFCRLLGYYVSEGSVSNYGKGYSVRFSFNSKEKKFINDVCSILTKFGLNHYLYTQNNVTHVGVKSTPFALFISDILGCRRQSNQKQLPEFIYFSPREHKEEFISGYLRGDGCFMPKLGLVSSATASKMLSAGFDILLLSLGYVLTALQTVTSPNTIEGRTIQGGTLYVLTSKMQRQYNSLAKIAEYEEFHQRTHSKQLWYTLHENLFMIRTTKTIHEEKEQYVYSIDTQNHHFVSTNGRLIHNCVIPNLDLMNESSLNIIREINEDYAKILKKRRSKNK